MKKIIILQVIILIALSACQNKATQTDKKPVVKVFDKYLYEDDIKEIIPEGLSAEDSAVKASNFIDVWIKKQLMVKQAETLLGDEKDEIEKQLENYRNSLLIYKYKEKYLQEKLDTNIADSAIVSYYNNHLNDFKLPDNAIRGIFVKVDKTIPEIDHIRRLMKSELQQDSVELRNFCIENNINYDDFKGTWVYFSPLINKIPVQIDDYQAFLLKRRFIEVEDDAFYYFLKIKEYRLKGQNSPLELVKSDIKSILINKNKRKLIDELEAKIYQNALAHGNLEYYK